MISANPENPVAIRPIEAADAPAVSALVTQLGYARTPQQVVNWIATAQPGQQAAFVACLNGKIAGWVEVAIVHHLQSPASALIGGLVVAEGIRGQGIGRALCRAAEQWGWRHGAEKIRVTSRSTRLDAHRFYARDGYRVVKTSMVFEKDRAE